MWTAIALQQELARNYKLEQKPVRRALESRDPIPKTQPLTLAQKLGLVKPPEPPLTEEEWKQVEQKAVERNAFSDTCPICMEPFGFRDHYILNCSHVFHKVNYLFLL